VKTEGTGAEQPKDRLTRGLIALSAVLLVAGVVAGLSYLRSGSGRPPDAAPLPPTSSAPKDYYEPPSAGATPVAKATGPSIRKALEPSTVSIAAIDQTDVPVVDASVADDQLVPPSDVHVSGIWTDGAALDATAGTTTIVGHVNYVGQGNGAFHDLASVTDGSSITTVDARGVQTAWTVTSIEVTDKSAGVDQAVFDGPSGARKLVLVTCGGPYDANISSYDDNVYVWAVPAR
jgi:hypothetical protein